MSNPLSIELMCACGFSEKFECVHSWSGNPSDWPITREAIRRGWQVVEGQYRCPHGCEVTKVTGLRACPDPGCQAYYGGHTPGCKLAPPEYKAAQLNRIYEATLQGQSIQVSLGEKVTFWQGKFNQVRQENNKLRKQLSALKQQENG